jgi:hypothetical protein
MEIVSDGGLERRIEHLEQALQPVLEPQRGIVIFMHYDNQRKEDIKSWEFSPWVDWGPCKKKIAWPSDTAEGQRMHARHQCQHFRDKEIGDR